MPNRRSRTVVAHYDGAGDAVGLGIAALQARLRRPWLWYGVRVEVLTPLGQRAVGVFEPEERA
jgi:hypothetical protein